ncbi:Cytochrome b5 reductase 4 [Apiospora rasikravindrae]|uniref:Cytochrome b5 reductase 4 n=1 Tax=Apiospora rasikravindrae TaxID=990691 RepID=A0ABR1RQK6_9PEZI
MALVGLSLVLASVVWVVFSRPPFLQRWFASLWASSSSPVLLRRSTSPPREMVIARPAALLDSTESREPNTGAAHSRGAFFFADNAKGSRLATLTQWQRPLLLALPDAVTKLLRAETRRAARLSRRRRTQQRRRHAPARAANLLSPRDSGPDLLQSRDRRLLHDAAAAAPPTLKNLNPAATSRAANLAAPNSFARSARQPGTSTLAPPPTHSSKPAKPSRKVMLEPGHSPLDWARLAQSPTSDLRNLPPGTPYLKVTPSQLKTMTGRRGKDAWTALGGRVYNMTPYVAFHPGGGPELLRAAGRDGTRLFGEIHPWVNYEGMLASCMIGMLVEEGEEEKSEMDDMD